MSCCSPNISLNFPPDINYLLSGAQTGLIATKDAFHKVVVVGAKTVDTVEGRSYSHMLLEAIFKIVELARGTLEGPLALLSPIIGTVDGVFAAWDIFGVGKYFFYKKPYKSEEPRIGKDPVDGSLYRKKKNVNQTEVDFHIQEQKFLKVVSKVGAFIKAIGAFGLFLHNFQVVNLSAISSHLSSLGTLGNIVSKIATPVFISAFCAIGGVITFGALTIDSITYIAKAVHNPEKSLVKGILDLASRVAALAAFSLMLAGLANPPILIPILVVGGIAGIASMIHTLHRDSYKAAQEKQNLDELLQRGQ